MVWHPVKRVWFADLDSGIARLELDMLRAVKVTYWRFAKHGTAPPSTYPISHVKELQN
jgi:hypothetical protein